MASNKRTCEQCGGMSSPHIPRQRVNDRMLCQGCASRELARTSASKKKKPSGAHLKPKPQATFDFWDGDLAPNEGVHPLQQPLPNSVWEKYAQHRELLGKPKIMMHDHLEEAEAKGAAKSGDSEPFPGSRGEAEKEQGPGRQQRLPFWRRRKGSLGKTAAESEKPAIESMQGQEAKDHLSMHHGWTSNEIEMAGLKGELYNLHQADHDHPKIGPTLLHSHGPLSEKSAPAQVPHPSSFNPKSYVDHMVEHHGWTAENAKTHADAGMQNALAQHKIDHQISNEDGSDLGHTHKSAGEIPHPQGDNEVAMHLMDHHGVGDWEMEGMDSHDLQDTHDAFHESTVYSGKDKPEHTHPEGVANQESAGDGTLHEHESEPKGQNQASGGHPPAGTMGGKGIAQHLKDHHGLSHNEVFEAFKSGGDKPTDGGYSAAVSWHDAAHAAGEPHTHGHAHVVASMSPEEMEHHLKNDHGIQGAALDNVKNNWGGSPAANLEQLHKNNHAGGNFGGTEHDHGGHVSVGDDGPEQLKNPGKYTNSSLHSHLLTDHGIDPDHLANAVSGTFEATDPSHVVHMLHNAAHANEQFQNEHSHENWKGAPAIHEGHTDVGQPFWGGPPNTAQKSIEHLTAKKSQGGHGLDFDELDEHLAKAKMPLSANDEESLKFHEQVHGDLHKQHGADLGHQHVPTVQPGVMSPEKAKKEQLKEHLKQYHGWNGSGYGTPEMIHSEWHDSDSFGYKGHPGHEHVPWDQHGALTQELPSGNSLPPNKNPGPDDFASIKPFNPGHHDHPSNMSWADLEQHIQSHHKNWTAGKNGEDPTPPTTEDFANNFFDDSTSGKSHSELLQQHALHHATGETNGHTHEPGGWHSGLEGLNTHYGLEPEIQTDTHPHIDNDHDALAHMIKHHPNVTQENYDDWHKYHQTGTKPSMVKFHDAIHNGGETAPGYSSKMPKVLDGHDHAEASGPPTQISVGSHLVHEHGMTQDAVAAMTPAEFKAHHEQLHLKKSEFDIGHGHEHPGGPVRDPRVILPNTHHQAMRDDDKHPAVQEWYHGTGTDYEGAPKNATELQEDHGFWGNFGGGDWNNHIGSHWSSLHQMSRNFHGSGNRVIHAKLHMSNPIVYNSLNHMTHDAYERLRASGHMQDDGRFEGRHGDDIGGTGSGCCSTRLLEYAKGHHRDDGKYGLEAYRDSLRASGYDGIHVRNQADHPRGHWNAIPMSADQIEITHGGCRGSHGDERDDDVSEFSSNATKLMKGWVHPKDYRADDYLGSRLDHLPTGAEVKVANQEKGSRPQSNKTAEGRGDSDPHLGHRDPDDLGNSQWCDNCQEDTDHNTENCEAFWCEHCDKHGNHDSDECENKWCNVCEEHGKHGTSSHDYCEHCENYADHDSDDCDKNPDNAKIEAYCPHCDESHEDNKHNENCVNCGQKMPDWGKIQAQGTPVEPGQHQEDGETTGADYGHVSKAKIQGMSGDHELAAHLYHHHKSDVSGKAFDVHGSWNHEALQQHHQWLHQNASEAEANGFEMNHEHKQNFGHFNKSMTPEETHAHMLLAHSGKQGGKAALELPKIAKMTPEQAVEAHKIAHMADDAVHWGEKDSDGDFIPKATHTHTLDGDQSSLDEAHYPEGEHLIAHLGDGKYHGIPAKHLKDLSPATVEALHHQFHKNAGGAAEPGVGKYHVHTPELLDEIHKTKAIKDHLTDDHGAPEGHYMTSGKSIDELMDLHHNEHQSQFPTFNDPEHTHFGGTAHKDPAGHTAETMKKQPAKVEQIKQHMIDHHGAPENMQGSDLHGLMSAHSIEHGKFPMLDAPTHDHDGLGTIQHSGDHAVHTNQTMKAKPSSEPEPEKDDSFSELKGSSVPDLLKDNDGSDLDLHMDYHHPEVYQGLEHSEGFWKAPNTPEFKKALQEAHQAHMKAHAEGSDHDHGGTAPKTKESSLHTLTDLFEEVAS